MLSGGGFCLRASVRMCVYGWVLYQVLNTFLKVKDLDNFVYLLPGKVFYSISDRVFEAHSSFATLLVFLFP